MFHFSFSELNLKLSFDKSKYSSINLLFSIKGVSTLLN